MSSKEYHINTYWNDADCGYRYTISDSAGEIILRSEDAYWYEENAKKAAEQAVATLK